MCNSFFFSKFLHFRTNRRPEYWKLDFSNQLHLFLSWFWEIILSIFWVFLVTDIHETVNPSALLFLDPESLLIKTWFFITTSYVSLMVLRSSTIIFCFVFGHRHSWISPPIWLHTWKNDISKIESRTKWLFAKFMDKGYAQR